MKGARPLSAAEVRAVLREFGTHRDRALFLTMLYTGARISEALALDVADVVKPADPEAFGDGGDIEIRRQIVFARRNTKGKHTSRAVDVHPALRSALVLYLEERRRKAALLGILPTGPLFLSGQKGRLTRSPASDALYLAFRAAGLVERVSAHSARKTFAQRLYNAGVPLPVVQELLGHADIRDTMRYFRVSEEQMATAIATLPELDGDAP